MTAGTWQPSPPTPHQRELGANLRAVRERMGLSLAQVEKLSAGEFKAPVTGSYERGDRAVTTERLADLCRLYAVTVAEVWPGTEWPSTDPEVVRGVEQMHADSGALLHLLRQQQAGCACSGLGATA